MKTIERSSAFKRDYKRVKATPRYNKNLDLLISDILECLLADKALPEKIVIMHSVVLGMDIASAILNQTFY